MRLDGSAFPRLRTNELINVEDPYLLDINLNRHRNARNPDELRHIVPRKRLQNTCNYKACWRTLETACQMI